MTRIMSSMTMIQQAGQAPAAARAASAADAEAARLDAQLEVAAKKAALRSLEAQAGTPADLAPVPLPSTGRIVIERDGKTLILDNPTAEQIAAISGDPAPSGPDPRMVASLASGILVAVVAVVWIVMHYRRNRAQGADPAAREMAARMARIENAIESVAEEVERISEGQRFAARMLSEGAAEPVNAQAMPAAVLNNRGNS